MLGKLVNSQIRSQAFYFDFKDANFIDGIYPTDCVIKRNAVIVSSFVKYFQDVSGYNSMTIDVVTDSPAQNLVATHNLPFLNIPNAYNVQVPVPAANEVATSLNNNNSTVFMLASGMTGSGITALSCVVVLLICEVDV